GAAAVSVHRRCGCRQCLSIPAETPVDHGAWRTGHSFFPGRLGGALVWTRSAAHHSLRHVQLVRIGISWTLCRGERRVCRTVDTKHPDAKDTASRDSARIPTSLTSSASYVRESRYRPQRGTPKRSQAV